MNDSEPPSSGGPSATDGAEAPPHHSGPHRLRQFLRLLRRTRTHATPIDAMVAAAEAEGEEIAPQERTLIDNVLKVHDRTAADVMVPRGDVIAIDGEAPFSELVKSLVQHNHSRLPVYRETLDDVIGYVHVKDVLAPVAERRPAKLAGLIRKVLFVPPSLSILDLLAQMRRARTHIAMVVDEFGGIDGLVTIEDLIEEIVGEIEDEHDVDETPALIERSDGSVIADARTPIETLEQRRGTPLRLGENQEDVDTLGGLVFTLAGRVPKRGEVILHPGGIEFEVLDADPNRIRRLRVRGLTAAGSNGKTAARA